jgi:ABC-type transporter Mla MlaB component
MAPVSLTYELGGNAPVLILSGDWRGQDLAPLRSTLATAAADPATHATPLRVDFSALTHADPAVIALLSLLWAHLARQGQPWQIAGIHPSARRCFKYACADYLLGPADATMSRDAG